MAGPPDGFCRPSKRGVPCHYLIITKRRLVIFHTYTIFRLLVDSCFIDGSFTVLTEPPPEPLSPQADTANPAAMFLKLIAAFTSRSCSAPQGQAQERIESGRDSATRPQAEQGLEEGE